MGDIVSGRARRVDEQLYQSVGMVVTNECQLCGSSEAEVTPAYLRVLCQASRGLGSDAQNFGCQCCAACFHEAGRIQALRFKVVLTLAIWLLLTPCCLAPLGLVLDENRSQLVNALILIPPLCVVAAGFVVGPMFLRIATRRRTEALLGAEVNRQIRRRARIRRWGLFTELRIVRQLPEGETAEPL